MNKLIAAVVALMITVGAVAFDVREAEAAYTFGTSPYADVLSVSTDLMNDPVYGPMLTGMSVKQLRAAILAVAWPETQKFGTDAPSPMTVGRWDISTALFYGGDNRTTAPYIRSFFSAGVGAWQMDSAGVGAGTGASEHINTRTAARLAGEEIARRWDYNSDLAFDARLQASWGAWYACLANADTNWRYLCREAYDAIYAPSTTDGVSVSKVTMDSLGGAKWESCYDSSQGVYPWSCLKVDMTRAQGNTSFITGYNDLGSPGVYNPLPYTFYVWGVESRLTKLKWTGKPNNILAYRYNGANARDGLQWSFDLTTCTLESGC